MLDGTELPALVANYRGFTITKASDFETIVREICPDESQVEVGARLQARPLQFVASQFPEGDEVRSLFCPLCASGNLRAQVKHEPRLDERLFLVRCADCGWEQQAKGDIAAGGCDSSTVPDAEEQWRPGLGAATPGRLG